MHTANKPKQAGAQAAYDRMKSLYTGFGWEVHEIDPVNGLPDMVYTANVGNVKNSTFIKANFRFEQRRREADLAEDFLETNFDLETITLPEGVYFEGQGDLLSDGNRYFFGYGKRSMYEAKPYLEDILNTRLVALELVDPYYYHLDTCFAPLRPDLVVINPQSFTEEGKKEILACFDTVIEASEEDNKVLACNLVHDDKTIVTGAGITPELRDKLAKFGYNTHEIDMHEYLKGGGSVKCCTFEF